MSTSYTTGTEKVETQSETMKVLSWIGGLINTFICFYAIYLSIKCNKGFNLGSFLAACCCAPCYVIYRLAMGMSGCLTPGAVF